MTLIADKENREAVENLGRLIDLVLLYGNDSNQEGLRKVVQTYVDEYLNLKFFLEQAKQRYSEELQEEESFEDECPYCDCEEEDENLNSVFAWVKKSEANNYIN
jgi:hypothetical protein